MIPIKIQITALDALLWSLTRAIRFAVFFCIVFATNKVGPAETPAVLLRDATLQQFARHMLSMFIVAAFFWHIMADRGGEPK